ncbi:DUF3813 family protein [Oceanobacillus alkalisoli]|uniref:DUF3813 family protein n=1 Tax=Oceanobacillus alkalisoli TaxID=2925113 RepID=UPI001EF07561|nr:DUF3813 family protein [Oceanobacillus alkalisoli]MCF3942060.1 DUF3813 family protein [Oceanobacillus alkalisoli]MCG5101987.1 DUF3813 family protein [Oceanobacillus alkalisoli]
MEQSRFQQARQRIMDMMNMGQDVTEADKEAVQHAIQAAYEEATPQEQKELEQLEQQLTNNQQL